METIIKEFKGTKDWEIYLADVDEDNSDPYYYVLGDGGEKIVLHSTLNTSELTREEWEANVKLQFNAPKLLEACQGVLRLRQLIEYPDSKISEAYQDEARAIHQMLNQVESAISSALGE